MKKLIILGLCLCSISLFSQDLTGIWQGNNEGTYYIRQTGIEVFWFGDGGTAYQNVFHGKIYGNLLFGDYADVPSGKNRNSGSVILRINSNNELERIWYSGASKNSRFTRGGQVTPDPSTSDSPVGKWETTWSDGSTVITFVKQENRIIGTYPYKSGRIEGTLEGNTIHGTWSQSNGGGEIIITFDSNFKSFTTRYKQDENWYSDWSGTRIE
jgi:hypothetical protein